MQWGKNNTNDWKPINDSWIDFPVVSLKVINIIRQSDREAAFSQKKIPWPNLVQTFQQMSLNSANVEGAH